MQKRKQTGKKKDAYSRQRRRRSCEAAEENLDVPSELIGRVPTFLYCYFKR
jgi:hypothetical protein